MATEKRTISGILVLLPFILALSLLASRLAAPTSARAQEAGTIVTITDREYVRNGTFDLGETGWYTRINFVNAVDSGGTDGAGLKLDGTSLEDPSYYVYTLHELHVPDQMTEATFSLDYRFEIDSNPAFDYFRVRLISLDSESNVTTLATMEEVTNETFPGTGWQADSYTFSSDEINQINMAHAAGERVLIWVELYARDVPAYLDNVSFRLSGEMTYPDVAGSIAFLGLEPGTSVLAPAEKEVAVIEPDGSDRHTLWTNPDPSVYDVHDLAWRPDAKELAFTSQHEEFYSVFTADVYAMRPDGSGLRRVTNPPSHAAVLAGNAPTGTVTGRLHNNSGLRSHQISSMALYIEGAEDLVEITPPDDGASVDVTVPNVADLGAGESQYAVVIWSAEDVDCAAGKELLPAAATDVQADQTVDVGTVDFLGNCNTLQATDLTWKRDGSQVGFTLNGAARSAEAGGEFLGSDLFSSPSFVEGLAWSPISDQLLYRRSLENPTGIYTTTPGGGAGTQLVQDPGFHANDPAWLPDESVFVYSLGTLPQEVDDVRGNLYAYDLANDTEIQLTDFFNERVVHPSVSPDGNYVVFARVSQPPTQWNLWVMDLRTPAHMWPVTTNGASTNPVWSRQEPQIPFRVYVPAVVK